MKKIFYLAIIALATVFTACEKEKDKNEPEDNSPHCYEVVLQYRSGGSVSEYVYGSRNYVSSYASEVLGYYVDLFSSYSINRADDSHCR